MHQALCSVPVCPLRSEPAHTAEMVSQLLFGEGCSILDGGERGWVKVVCAFDGYEGWCQEQQLVVMEEPGPLPEERFVTSAWVSDVWVASPGPAGWPEAPMRVPLGSALPRLRGGRGSLANLSFSFSGEAWDVPKRKPGPEMLRDLALQFLHSPYIWGGRSVFGVDCSGFTQTVYRLAGVRLQRDAHQQATQGEMIDFLPEAHPGDLVFFDNEEGRITHVGLLLQPGEIIHASGAGQVRIDRLDTQGIVHRRTGVRTHHLRIVRRMY